MTVNTALQELYEADLMRKHRLVTQRFGGLKRNDDVGSAFAAYHRLYVLAEAHDRGHRTAALRHAVNFRNLDVKSGRQRSVSQQVGSKNGALIDEAL